MTKSELRIFYKNIRNSIDEQKLLCKSNAVFNNLTNMDIIKDSKTFFVYNSYNREVSTKKIIEFLLDNDKTVLIPKCNKETETMVAVEYTYDTKLENGNYGINEPINDDVFLENIDVVIVPGIAFDIFGNRIGYGKGYYDKFLENKDICKIALSYEETISHSMLPHDSGDIVMDYIVSDRGVYKINSKAWMVISQN